MFNDPEFRKWLYGIISAVGLILSVYGLVTDTQLSAWAGLATSLVNGLAFVKTGKHSA
jgi:hypothetical protein